MVCTSTDGGSPDTYSWARVDDLPPTFILHLRLRTKMLSSTLAQRQLDEYTPFGEPQDSLEALSSLIAQWKLPASDAQTARMLIERARVQYSPSFIQSTKSPSPLSQTPPFDPSWPIPYTYRSSTSPSSQAIRTFARTHAPISALSDDIMQLIFAYVAAEREPAPASEHEHGHAHAQAPLSLDWLVVTFVSRYWRHLALAHTRLWTCVPVRTPDLLCAFAQRARDQPLALVFGAAGASRGALEEAAAGQMGRVHLDMLATARRLGACPALGRRIRSLTFLDGSASAHWLTMARFLPAELPQLEVLRLEGADTAAGSIVGHILGEGAPALRSLSVTGCSFPPELCRKCPNLRELRLVRNANADSLGPTEILGMLEALPQLGTLHFEARAQVQSQAQNQAQNEDEEAELLLGSGSKGAVVSLEHLRSLTLVSDPRATAHILARLSLLPSASVSLAFPASDGSVLATHRDEIFARLPALAKCTHLSLVVHASKVTVHTGFSSGDADTDAPTGTRFCVQYRRDYDFSQHFAGVAALVPALTSLSVAVDLGRRAHSVISAVSEGGWRRLLAGLPRLTSLAVSSNVSFSHRALFRVLRATDGCISADGVRKDGLCVPALRTLHFVDLTLRADRCFCGCTEADGARDGVTGGDDADGTCGRVRPTVFYAHRDQWAHDDEHVDNAALWIEGLRRTLEGRRQRHCGTRPLRVRLSASSSRSWRASSCHHSEILRALGGLVDVLEFVSPGA